ncbi:hypothetical protein [Flindersiella endophytica]
MLIPLFVVAVLATVAGVVLLGRTDQWHGLAPWFDRGLRLLSVGLGALAALLAFFKVTANGFAVVQVLLLVGLPLVVVVLATFLPLSTRGNQIAGWLGAAFLVGFVIVQASGVGAYFVLPALVMVAAAVAVTPLPVHVARWLHVEPR